MNLLIDIGNSCLKWATANAGVIGPVASIGYKDQRLAASNWFSEITNPPDDIYLISVADTTITSAVIQRCVQQWQVQPRVLQTQWSCAGVVNGYAEPAKLGVDRWAALVAGYHCTAGAVLVVDCGTACTADLVSVEGIHLGGEIMPGAQLLRNTLQSSTSAIELNDNTTEFAEWGSSTTTCVEAGVVTALCGFIERLHRRAQHHLQVEVSVVLTGGGAPLLLPRLGLSAQHESGLVFQGMTMMVAEMSSNGRTA